MILDADNYTWSSWTQPKFTSNTTWGVLSASSINVGGHEPYVALDGNLKTQWENKGNAFPADFIWEFAKPLKISKIVLTNKSSGSSYLSKTVKVYAEKEKKTLINTSVFAKNSQSVVTITFKEAVCLDMVLFEFPDTYDSHAGLSEISIVAEVGEEKKPTTKKYLLTDKAGKYYGYNAETGELTEVAANSLNSAAFLEYGFDVLPPGDAVKTLTNPALLFWQDSEDELPSFCATVQAIPFAQTVFAENKKMIHESILGIENMQIDADDSTLFAFSFDNGKTWKAYVDNAWATLSEETSGINKTAVESIGSNAWEIANEQRQYKIRFTLFEGGYCKKITINYLN